MFRRPLLLTLSILIPAGASTATPISAAEQSPRAPASICQAIASRLPAARYARLDGPTPPAILAAAPTTQSVRITYVGHSTYFLETPGGVTIATDYSGALSLPSTPMVATMNKAHSGHFTPAPDPTIQYALPGWIEGGKAQHRLVVGDAFIRNVTSDLRTFGGGTEPNGNSIFIFETAGLCIGHLGHLHFELNEDQIADIGRLDIVMVPVDGGVTMTAPSMSRTVKRLRASLVLLMHRLRYGALEDFLAGFGGDFATDFSKTPTLVVSLATLPRKPTIFVPPNL